MLYKQWFKTCKIPLGLGEVSERDDRFHFCVTILCDTHLESQGISLPRLSALQVSVETVFHSSPLYHSSPFLCRYLFGLGKSCS